LGHYWGSLANGAADRLARAAECFADVTKKVLHGGSVYSIPSE
jgi:hypothetical protein